jgi:autotransporter translocation and assembly factor TamB
VLALVAFGQTRSQVSQGGAGALVGEAAGFIVEDLFGPGPGNLPRLDVMEVDTTESGTRAVRVGRRLTPNTLVVYSQGITNADQRKLRIEYQVFGPLVLAGEQDFRGGFGGDVLLRVRFR